MTLRHLKSTVTLLKSSAGSLNIEPIIIIRNNAPDSQDIGLVKGITEIARSTSIPIQYERSPHNLGFGAGHNLNFRLNPGDFFWALNNDISFPHLNWLSDVLRAFADQQVSLVGPANSMSTLSPGIAAGRHRAAHWLPALYAEGSSLFVRSEHFIDHGIFDESFDYAYYEDVDLSFRTLTRGLRMSVVDMPHEHLRSTSASLIPSATKGSVMESNRSKFLARWERTLERGQVSGSILIDLCAVDLSQVIASLRSVTHLYREALARGSAVHIKLDQGELEFLFKKLTPQAKLYIGTAQIDYRTYDRIASLRDLNFSTPFHMEDLIAAAFGTPDLGDPLDLREILGFAQRSDSEPRQKAVVHFSSDQMAFEGLNLPPQTYGKIIDHLISRGLDVTVVVGLDGGIPLEDLFDALSGTDMFIGIDSGPLHAAQALGTPSFGIFGATHPLARMRPSPINAAFSHPDLGCLGCSHGLIEPAPNWCMRRDQACVAHLPLPPLLEALDAFIAGATMDWHGPFLGFEILRRRWLMNQICNPSFRNRLLSYDGEAGRIPDMLVQVLGIIEEQSRSSLRRTVESELHAMSEKLSERDRQFKALQASRDHDNRYLLSVISAQEEKLGRLSGAMRGSPSGQSPENGGNSLAAPSAIELDVLRDLFLECHLIKRDDLSIIECLGADPQIHIKQSIFSGSSGLSIKFDITSDTNGEFQLFYREAKYQNFDEVNSARSTLMSGRNFIEILVPIVNSDVILRIDPLNTAGTVAFHKMQVSPA